MNIFLDSDVVISSLLSDRGAAYLLLKQRGIKLFVSDLSIKEIEVVAKRLSVDRNKLHNVIESKLHVVLLKQTSQQIQTSFIPYVIDKYDAHIVAGAHEAQSKFLISYNLRHFKTEQIKRNLGIIVLTPGTFIQYLRSL